MANKHKEFNTGNFIKYVLLFGGVAGLMLLTKPKDDNGETNNPFPLYELHLSSKNAAGSIILNGISIGHHKSGERQETSKISLTPWLLNGENTLSITTSNPALKAAPDLKVELETIPKTGKAEHKTLFHLKAASAKTVKITAKGLPVWQWLKGAATFHDSEELKAAVANLHKAYGLKETKTIRKIEAPLFQDMDKLTGRPGLERRVYRNEIIEKGTLEALPPVTIVPFDNGRIMRVSGPDGEAPIRVYFKYGNGGKVILTGQFWSKIKGNWHVVR